jgi:signal transduction histidine kinase
VARKIVDRHGGRVHVEDVSGPGARFVVELPVAGAAG